jgi:hypothetical protein
LSGKAKALSTQQQSDPAIISQGLAKVRQRRWLLWGTIIIYIPGLFIFLPLGLSGGTLTKLFCAWVALLCVVVGLATVVKCPGCGNPFHTNGPTFLPLRKCVHCGLHLVADKKAGQRHGDPLPLEKVD